jgi:hypothetical protein
LKENFVTAKYAKQEAITDGREQVTSSKNWFLVEVCMKNLQVKGWTDVITDSWN